MGRKVVTASFCLPERLIARLDEYAAVQDISRSKVLQAMLNVYFNEEE